MSTSAVLPPANGAQGGRAEADQAQAEQRARHLIVDRLAAAPRSVAQCAEYLRGKGFDEDVVAGTVAWLHHHKLVDDAEFARALVRSKSTFNHRGRRAIAMDLRRAGVGEAEAEAALAEVSNDDEAATAQELARKRLPSLRSLPPEVAQRRLFAALARRGFSSELCRRVTMETLACAFEEGQP